MYTSAHFANISRRCCFLVRSGFYSDETHFEDRSRSAQKDWYIMLLVTILGDFLSNPLSYPLWWLSGSWLIWLLLKWTPVARPHLPVMLIYSVAVLIQFVKSFRELEACLVIDLCAPYFSLLWFVADVACWFLVLYALMKWILRMEQNKSGLDSVMMLKR